jgi:hypothetical protein
VFIPSTTMLQPSHSDSTAQWIHTKLTNIQQQSPLFKLPSELRKHIYSHATSQSEAKRSEAKKPREFILLDRGYQLTHRYDLSFDYRDHRSFSIVSLNHTSDVKPSNALHGYVLAYLSGIQSSDLPGEVKLSSANRTKVGPVMYVSALQQVLAPLVTPQNRSTRCPKFIVALTIRGSFDSSTSLKTISR